MHFLYYNFNLFRNSFVSIIKLLVNLICDTMYSSFSLGQRFEIDKSAAQVCLNWKL